MQVSVEELKKFMEQAKSTSYIELRYHEKVLNEIRVSNGELDRIRSVVNDGIGIRVLVSGCWGFSSTSEMSRESVMDTINNAISSAGLLAESKQRKVEKLAEANLAVGTFKPPLNGNLTDYSIEEKIKLTIDSDALTKKYSNKIKATSCVYRETMDQKIIVNTDGASAELFNSKPEFSVTAVAKEFGDSITASEGIGITGGWNDLFDKKSANDIAKEAAQKAIKLLKAKRPKGERTQVILDPGMVGLISHEAIGHTVEADFVLSGSIIKDKIGQKVASDLVTLIDSGPSQFKNGAAGTIFVDDEGVVTGRTVIIENGIMRSYLHNRETAAIFSAKPTGNARAYEYDDEPLIRMRNTFIEPGSYSYDEIIKETKHGYLLKGAENGQADANGEFMFGSQEAYLIENGEIRQLLRGASISGRALDVLMTVDAVGKDFEYDIGTGYCMKYQPIKVDGGGPHIRCIAIVGGIQ
ncbi:MAG: Zn-dependent protease [Thaumarchaeota archaeon]|nr:Zn-dependent protease [Nitrososphaerota archaeon]